MRPLINSIFLICFQLLALVSFVSGDSLKPILSIALISLSLYPLFFIESWPILKNRVFQIFCLVAIIFLPFQLFNNTLTPGLLYVVAAPLLAFHVVNSQFSVRLIALYTYAVLAWLLYSAATTPITELNTFFIGSSRNTFSTLAITNSALYLFISKNQNHYTPTLPSILSFAIAIFAIGRSGIICTCLIFFAALYVNIYQKIKYNFLKMIVVIIIIWGVINNFASFYNLDQFTHLANNGVESGARYSMLTEYIGRLDIISLFVGYDYTQIPIIAFFDNNPHNSFIKLHYFYGFCLFIMVWFIYLAEVNYYRQGNLLFAVTFMAIIIRASTDAILFVGFYDYIFYIYLFYPFSKLEKSSSCEQPHRIPI